MPDPQVRYVDSVGGRCVLNTWWFVGGVCYRRMKRLHVFPNRIGRSSYHGEMKGVCRVVTHTNMIRNIAADQISISFWVRLPLWVGLFPVQATMAYQGPVTVTWSLGISLGSSWPQQCSDPHGDSIWGSLRCALTCMFDCSLVVSVTMLSSCLWGGHSGLGEKSGKQSKVHLCVGMLGILILHLSNQSIYPGMI